MIPAFLRRRGTLIALLGPDGTGKTTTAEALSKRIGGIFQDRVPVCYMGPWSHHQLFLARLVCRSPDDRRGRNDLSQALRGAISSRAPRRKIPLSLRLRLFYRLIKDTPHSELDPQANEIRKQIRDHSILYNLASFAYHHVRNAIDFVILSVELYWRYLRCYYLLRRGVHVIADRYAYDLLSGTARRVTGESHWFGVLFCAIYPKPDATFLLWNDSSVISTRKSDLDGRAADIMLDFYRKVADTYDFCSIKTDRPVEEIVNTILTAELPGILSRFYPERDRQSRRLGV